MSDHLFRTKDGMVMPAVTAEQMRKVDRIAVEEFGLGILQMMENAGRNLAENVLDMLDGPSTLRLCSGQALLRTRARGEVAILAGSGGNGGGGLCCARHLHNRGFQVWVVLDREAAMLTGAARSQFQTLQAAGLQPVDPSQTKDVLRRSQVVVDALIGYGLRGAPRGKTAELIELCNQHAVRVLSLDVPSGLDATTGEAPGPVVCPERTLTLALPKTGLSGLPGELYLADASTGIGHPAGGLPAAWAVFRATLPETLLGTSGKKRHYCGTGGTVAPQSPLLRHRRLSLSHTPPWKRVRNRLLRASEG